MDPGNLIAILIFLAIFPGVPILLFYFFIRGAHSSERNDPDLCETCGYDLRESQGRCPECGGIGGKARYHQLRRLREEWPADAIAPRRPAADETLVVVRESFDRMELDLLAEHLEVRGITSSVADAPELAPGIAGYSTPGKSLRGTFKLAVWSADAPAAREIIDRLLLEVSS